MSTTQTTLTTTPFISGSSALAKYNRGPITTAYSPPASCTATLTMQSFDSSIYFGHAHNSYVNTDCYPIGTIAGQDLIDLDNWSTYFYSPAICPINWTTVTRFTSTIDAGANDVTVISLGSDTSAALCCPSGYAYLDYGHRCISSLTPNQIFGYVLATNLGADGWQRGTVTSSTMTTASTVSGDGVVVWWQSSDLALLASASTILPATTSGAINTDTATTGATDSIAQTSLMVSIPSSTSTSPPTDLPHSGGSSGLSTGDKIGMGIGIGVGVPLAVLLGLTMGFFFIRRRRGVTTDGSVRYELGATGEPKPGARYHSASRSIHEMDTNTERYHSRHELPQTQ